MAKKEKPLKVLRVSVRNRFAFILLPALAIPVVVWAFIEINSRFAEAGAAPLEWHWWAAAGGFLLLFPLWAFFQTRGTRFVIRRDRLVEERGIFSRSSREVRYSELRNIVVEQTFPQRLLRIGNVTFTTSDGQSVTFSAVPSPKQVRENVDELREGRIPDDYVVKPKAPKPKKLKESKPEPKPEKASKDDKAPASGAAASSSAKSSNSGAEGSKARPEAAVKESKTNANSAAAASDTSRAEAGSSGGGSESDDSARDELWALLEAQEAEEEGR